MFSYLIAIIFASGLLAATEPIPGYKPSACSKPSAPTVQLGNQHIIGVATKIPDSPNAVNKFLGVRFADQPKRFAPASKVDVSASSGVVQATASPAACPQQFFASKELTDLAIAVFEK